MIAVVAINARYTHAGLGARFLLANLGDLRTQSKLLEFNINEPIEGIAASITEDAPEIVGIGVYIWNRPLVEELVPLLREQLPDAAIVLGGPEISHDVASELGTLATCVICGEGEVAFAETCRFLLRGDAVAQVVHAPPPDLLRLALPYDAYTAHDLAHRAVYVESSRGCPHGCEYCLSAIDPCVRSFEERRLHQALGRMIEAGVRNLRFVDRSFNLGGARACRLLDHLLTRLRPGLCIHLELTPDELSAAFRERLTRFPAGHLHVEVGIQTLDTVVSERMGRPMDPTRVEEGVRFLVEHTAAEVHADLIAGLPGETPTSFIAGFETLHAWGPDEIQLGILKRLHGAPIERHTQPWEMLYRSTPPYDVLQTATMPSAFVEDVTRFAAHWERVVNRGQFPATSQRLVAHDTWKTFDTFSRRLACTHGLHGLGLIELCRELLAFMAGPGGVPAGEARALLRQDYLDGGTRMHLPAFLRE